MKPDARKHNPDPAYLRGLLDAANIGHREAGVRLGLGERIMRYYLSLDPRSHRPAPYVVQYAIERLTARPRPR